MYKRHATVFSHSKAISSTFYPRNGDNIFSTSVTDTLMDWSIPVLFVFVACLEGCSKRWLLFTNGALSVVFLLCIYCYDYYRLVYHSLIRFNKTISLHFIIQPCRPSTKTFLLHLYCINNA